MLLLSAIIFGLVLGSFANVYFYRLPRRLSLILPGSACPRCGQALRWYDNIPIVSFVWLKGQCRFCKAKISWQYPTVEFLCAGLLTAIALRFSEFPLFFIGVFWIFGFILFLVGGIDFITFLRFDMRYGVIPDHLIVILGGVGLAFSFWNPFVYQQWWFSVLSGIGTGLFMLLVRWGGSWFFKKEALGLGDVKLLSVIGCFLGWQGVVWVLILASIIGTGVSLFFILNKKLKFGSDSPVPFGPFLVIGAYFILLQGI
jgi:leader peptidase (prepilin peptidase)/N-methyltransferase